MCVNVYRTRYWNISSVSHLQTLMFYYDKNVIQSFKVFRLQKKIRDNLVSCSLYKIYRHHAAGTFSCSRARCYTCSFLNSAISISGPKSNSIIQHNFTCTSFYIIYCISCSYSEFHASKHRLYIAWLLLNMQRPVSRLTNLFAWKVSSFFFRSQTCFDRKKERNAHYLENAHQTTIRHLQRQHMTANTFKGR